jgi:hypothetical protein
MKNAPDQSAPVGLKSVKFRSLPDRHILLYFLKYIHFPSTSFPTRSDMTGFKIKKEHPDFYPKLNKSKCSL